MFDFILRGVDFVIQKFKENQKRSPYVNPHYFPSNWKGAGLPSGEMCYWCKREYPAKGRFDKPYCDEK